MIFNKSLKLIDKIDYYKMNSILNRYDNEFIGFLNEIGIRLIYFNREASLKIRSWIKILSLPYATKEEKQNRNLYAIKLINQMINGKIKYPFNNYANINEFKPLLAIDIKAELTQKFYKEINIEKITNYGYEMQKKYLSSNPQYYNTFQNNNNNLIRNSNITDFSNFTNSIDFNDNKYYLSSRNEDNNFDNYEINLNNNNIQILGSGNNNIKNVQKVEKDINDYINYYNIDMNDKDNEKLYQIIEQLKKRINEDDKIIEYQANEINKLNNILNNLNIQFNINDNNI